MEKSKRTQIDIEIDKLTNSISNIITGEIFETVITQLNVKDIKKIKKNDWVFNWASEIKSAEKKQFLN